LKNRSTAIDPWTVMAIDCWSVIDHHLTARSLMNHWTAIDGCVGRRLMERTALKKIVSQKRGECGMYFQDIPFHKKLC
jgi:hypothetical protein